MSRIYRTERHDHAPGCSCGAHAPSPAATHDSASAERAAGEKLRSDAPHLWRQEAADHSVRSGLETEAQVDADRADYLHLDSRAQEDAAAEAARRRAQDAWTLLKDGVTDAGE